MKITRDLAMKIAINAGDIHMREAGREKWASEDCAAATAVFEQLIAGSVQKEESSGIVSEDSADS